MDPFIGTFAVDDNVNTMKLTPRTDAGASWGTAMGTGWTAELLVYKAGVSTLYTTLTGSWETAAELACLFTIGTVTLLAPTGGKTSQDYEALLRLTKVSSEFTGGPAGDARSKYKFTVTDVEP